MKNCNACGKSTPAVISLGGTILCRPCAADVEVEIARLRSEGKPVNTMHIARRIYREQHRLGDYLLKDIPEELWTQAKHRGTEEGKSLREMLLEGLRAYLGKEAKRG